MDRRVERLERQAGELQTAIELMKQEQGHLRELMTSGFASLDRSLSGLSGKVEGFVASMATQSGDAAATPAGREVLARIADVTAEAKEALRLAGRLERRLWVATGALGVIVWVAAVFGPTIAKMALGLQP